MSGDEQEAAEGVELTVERVSESLAAALEAPPGMVAPQEVAATDPADVAPSDQGGPGDSRQESDIYRNSQKETDIHRNPQNDINRMADDAPAAEPVTEAPAVDAPTGGPDAEPPLTEYRVLPPPNPTKDSPWWGASWDKLCFPKTKAGLDAPVLPAAALFEGIQAEFRRGNIMIGGDTGTGKTLAAWYTALTCEEKPRVVVVQHKRGPEAQCQLRQGVDSDHVAVYKGGVQQGRAGRKGRYQREELGSA